MYRYATWFIGLESNNYFKRTYDIIVKEIAHLKNIKIVLFQAIIEQSNLPTIQYKTITVFFSNFNLHKVNFHKLKKNTVPQVSIALNSHSWT